MSAQPVSPHPASLPHKEKEEDGVLDFASLMPNFFSGAQQYELDFQDIHRLLTIETSKDTGLNPTSFMTQALASNWNKGENNDGAQGLELQKNSSPSIRSGYVEGKENAAPNKTAERHRPLRRERSSRRVSHRRPFVFDLRSFGSLLSKGTSGDYKNLKDVHAFWEAAEEQEASDAIMRKLRGENCSQKVVAGRRPAVRRKNSQRTTTRLKGFTVELPLCTEQMKLIDEEQLEEEEDGTDESCFTFLKQPEVRPGMDYSAFQDQVRQVDKPQQGASIYPDRVIPKIAFPDDSGKVIDHAESEHEMPIVLHDDESPNVHSKFNTTEHHLDQPNIVMKLDKDSEVSQASEEGLTSEQSVEALSSAADSKEVHLGAGDTRQGATNLTPCDKHQSIIIPLLASPTSLSNPVTALELRKDQVLQEDNGRWRPDFATTLEHLGAANTLQDPIKVTPYNKCSPMLQTPLTTPTPPSNPIAAYGLRKDSIFQQDVGKRKLDFDNAMNSPAVEPPLSASTENRENLFAYVENPEKLSQNPDLGGEVGLSSSNDVLAVATKNADQSEEKGQKRVTAKRRRDIDRRDSLEGAGTKWEGQVRRSTRIRSRPLDWWRGERFLKGRIHKSLVTVIGIKYSSPPPCWAKRGAKQPDFKVESFVSEDYAKYVEFAALC